MWKTINNLLNKNSKINPEISLNPLNDNDLLNTNNISIPDRFNNYFVNVGLEISKGILPTHANHSINDTLKDNESNHIFQIFPTTPAEAKDIILNLKHKNFAGYDNLNQHVPVFIESADIIAEALFEIINTSFKTGILPDKIKIAKIIPIFKSGSKHIESNYRPIANLPVFSKIIEKAMFTRMLTYLDKYRV